jgi:predicted RNA-binding protein with PUA-like domain
MQSGDRVLFYESGGPKAVVGLAEVTRTAFPDTTTREEGWWAVELKAGAALKHPVTLDRIKQEPTLRDMVLVKLSRLSVQPVTAAEFDRVVEMGS